MKTAEDTPHSRNRSADIIVDVGCTFLTAIVQCAELD